MKKHFKGIIIGFLLAVLVFNTMNVIAALPALRWAKIDAAFGYTVYVDGVKFEPRDRNGIIESLNYNGWIYAPFEHIAKAIDMPVYWEAETRSLYLGRRTPVGVRVPFFQEVPAYDVSQQSRVKEESGTMGGITHSEAMVYQTWGSAEYSLHNLGGVYREVRGYIGRVDGTNKHGTTFNFYGDGRLLESFEIEADDFPKLISVNVAGVTQLKIECGASGWLNGITYFAFAGATIE